MEDESTRVGAHRGKPAGITAPPCVDRREFQRLTEQVACRVAEERLQPQPICDTAAERIGHATSPSWAACKSPVTPPRPEGRLERIRSGVGEPAENHIDLLEPAEGSQPHVRRGVIRSPLLARW